MSGFLSKQELEALVTGSVQTADIADGAVAEAKIADGAVAGAKIADGAVGNAKVAADAAIAASKLGTGAIKVAVIDGGSAGDHTVTGIAAGDALVSVLRYDIDTGTVVGVSDLTGEFTISAADTINNAEGTDTTGDKLLVVYEDRSA